VVNGDILTTLNYQSMLEFHRENGAVMTVGVRPYEVEVPYGVIHTEGVQITRLSEKPTMRFFVNAGVYLLEPKVSRHVRAGQRCDMTDLIDKLLVEDERVVSFPINEYWVDIGHHESYELAQAEFVREELQ
jgi:NDP-sugar pyrophosphorylase family protein